MKNIILKSSLIIIIGISFFSKTADTLAQKKEVFVPASSRQVIYGKVTDEKGKPIIAQIQIWYARLTPVVMNYGNSKPAGRTDNLIGMVYTNDKGYFSIKVTADTLNVIITKGPEWSIAEKTFIIKEREFNGIEFNAALKRLYNLEKLGWYAGDPHHHTIFSDASQSPSDIAKAMKGVGLSWGILTDHNSDAGVKEWLAEETKDFIPVHGCEITTEPSDISNDNGYGHLNQSFINKMNGKNVSDPNIWARARFDGHKDVQAAIDSTHKQNGFITVNHPFQSWDWSGRFKSWGKVKNFDAIEIWNGEPPHSFSVNDWDSNHVNINTWGEHVWFAYLNSGNKISALAGSDCHDIYGVSAYPKGEFYWTTTTGNPRTYAYTGRLSRRAIRKSLTDGKLFLTSSFGPLLIATVNGKMPGEVVKVPSGGTVTIEFEVLANKPLLKTSGGVRIIYNGSVVRLIPTDSVYVVKQKALLNVQKDGWIALEAFGPWPMYAVTNAVYLDLPPYGDNFSKDWKDPENTDKWNIFPQHPENYLPDGPQNYKDVKKGIIK